MESVDSCRPPARGEASTRCDGLGLLSISHRTAPLADLERMTLSPPRLATLRRRWRAEGLEAVLLATCNRTELYTFAREPADHTRARALFLAAVEGPVPGPACFLDARARAAAAHLFRVAAGLESLIVGEAEVLGQTRAAIEEAEAAGTTGFLSALFRSALRFGGRARSETRIGAGALSVASAAVRLLTGERDDLATRTVLVLGAGDTALKAARHLKAEGVGRLVIANRTLRRAETAAAALGAEAAALADVSRLGPALDAMVTAVRVERPPITVAWLQRVRAGSSRPLILVDLSLPRAIDPACSGLPAVTLHDMSGLERIVTGNLQRRACEIPRVLALLERELEIFVDRRVSDARVVNRSHARG